MAEETSIWHRIFEGLKGHPEATLAGACLLVGVTLYAARADALFAAGLPTAIYILYILRMWMHDRHEERKADQAIEYLEKGKGTETRQRTRKALERRRSSDD